MTFDTRTAAMQEAGLEIPPEEGRLWFLINPGRSHRLCEPFQYEIDGELAGCEFVYAVIQQLEPGKLQKLYYLPDEPISEYVLDNEFFAHVLHGACEHVLIGGEMLPYTEILDTLIRLCESFEAAIQ